MNMTQINPASKVQFALSLARDGYYLFPLAGNARVPPEGTAGRFADISSRDEAQLRQWFDGTDANIGVDTSRWFDGQRDLCLLVLDVDMKHGKNGRATLAELEALHGALPDTRVQQTTTGGLHYFFLTRSTEMRNTAGKIGEGLDTRATGGYVVGAGSTIDGRAYVTQSALPPALAPAWLEYLLETTMNRPADREGIELNRPDNLQRAEQYLMQIAATAVEGQGGDATTLKVIFDLKDMGLSPRIAYSLLLTFWNPVKAIPPWNANDLWVKVENAYRYGTREVGGDSADTDLGSIDLGPLEAPEAPPAAVADREPWAVEAFSPDAIRKRPWVCEPFLMRGTVAGFAGPGGAGKSSWTIATALAICTGRGELIGSTVNEQTNVLLLNVEDDMDEMKRRLFATMEHLGVTFPEIEGRLFIESRDTMKLVVRAGDHKLVASQELLGLVKHIGSNGIGVVIVDPLVELHEAEEQDNREMQQVIAQLRTLARGLDVAVAFVHHVRKPSGAADGLAGNSDMMRGASAIRDGARMVAMFAPMGTKEADQYDVDDSERWRYFSVSSGKGNYSRGGFLRWYRKESHLLVNGDEVGVAKPYAFLQDTAAEVARVAGHPVPLPTDDKVVDAMRQYVVQQHGEGEEFTVQADLLADALRTFLPTFGPTKIKDAVSAVIMGPIRPGNLRWYYKDHDRRVIATERATEAKGTRDAQQ